MTKVTDPKVLKLLQKQSAKPLEPTGVKVTDPDLINVLQSKSNDKSLLSKVGTGIYDFFSGTKRTEFPELQEIGKATGLTTGQEFKIAAGLNITPNQKAQAEIIQAQVPGTNVFNDKFGNPIVTFPDGKSYYLNKPGASEQDIIQTTSQILQYIPGQSYFTKKLGKNFLLRGVGAGAAGGATSVAQDIAAKPLGAKDIDIGKALVSTAAPFAFEGIINPIAGATFRKIFGNPKFTETIDGTVQLNKKGLKAAKAAGLDPKKLDNEFIEQFNTELSRGVKEDLASVQAGAGKFGFRLSVAQASQNQEGIAALREASKGSFGPQAQETALGFFKRQGIDIGNSAEALGKKLNKGIIDEMSLDDAGELMKGSILRNFTKASDEITNSYNMIDKDAVFNGGESNMKNLLTSINKPFNEGEILDTTLTPATVKGIQFVDDFVNKYRSTSPRPVTKATFNDFEILRRKFSSLFNATANKTDRRSLTVVKKEFDKFYDDALDNALFGSGDNPLALEAIKKARYHTVRKQELFGENAVKKNGFSISDRTGKIVNQIMHDPDVTPTKTIDYIFGTSTVGRKDTSLGVVKKLKDIFGVEGKDFAKESALNPDFQALRTSAFEKILRNSIQNGRFVPKKFHDQYKTIMKDHKDVMKELFADDELQLIDEFTNEVAKTFKGSDLVNHSNTASGLQRMVQQFGRGLFGIVGFKIANIQGLLAFRGLFDRTRDIYSQRAAKKLIETELRPSLMSRASPKTTAVETAITNRELGKQGQVKAPQIPMGLINN